MSYNGCTNWETWHYKLYFLDDLSEEEQAEKFEGMDADSIADALREEIESYAREVNAYGIIRSFIDASINSINFNELSEDVHEVCERITREREREEAWDEARSESEANEYRIMKERQQAEYNAFTADTVFFAFTQEQFNEGLQKIGLTPDDTDKIYKLCNTGGFILKTASKAHRELLDRFDAELQEAINADTNGENFIYQMFYYELANHEYIITFDEEPTLDAIGLTADDLNANPKLLHGLNKAITDMVAWHQKFGELAS